MSPDTRCPTCGGLAEPDTASNAITYWRSAERERALEEVAELIMHRWRSGKNGSLEPRELAADIRALRAANEGGGK